MSAATGRRVSDSMRLRDFTRWLAKQPKPAKRCIYEYRGLVIAGRAGHWCIELQRDPRSFTSKAKAEAAVDRCIAIREELGRDPITGECA